MSFRFNKRIKIAPGVRINLGRTGISTSFGVKGASVNVGRGKTRLTVGLPGTGLSSVSEISGNSGKNSGPARPEDANSLMSPKAIESIYGAYWNGFLAGGGKWIIGLLCIVAALIASSFAR